MVREIRDRVERYLSSDISLQALEDWFLPATWDLAEDDQAFDLAAEIRLCLAEFSMGHRDETELAQCLTEAIASPTSTGATTSPKSTGKSKPA
jgi:hypothetical protein